MPVIIPNLTETYANGFILALSSPLSPTCQFSKLHLRLTITMITTWIGVQGTHADWLMNDPSVRVNNYELPRQITTIRILIRASTAWKLHTYKLQTTHGQNREASQIYELQRWVRPMPLCSQDKWIWQLIGNWNWGPLKTIIGTICFAKEWFWCGSTKYT